jgi:hypothetical protein
LVLLVVAVMIFGLARGTQGQTLICLVGRLRSLAHNYPCANFIQNSASQDVACGARSR